MNRYPIYIVSKGRANKQLTAAALQEIGLPYLIVCEPQEYHNYCFYNGKDKVLCLPFQPLNQGSTPARNFIWRHALERGFAKHWILDDNIRRFLRFNRNLKIKVVTPGIFEAAEDFCDRYNNLAIAGFNYRFLVPQRVGNKPPITINTRVYSCILLDNNLPAAWRLRFNEDTDLSLQALKAGFCTVLFNAFLCRKEETQTMTGGNTPLYAATQDRFEFVRELYEHHPKSVQVTRKFGRWHHHVNYDQFKQKLQRKHAAPAGVNEYGMRLYKK